jgi:methylglyoxal synthase
MASGVERPLVALIAHDGKKPDMVTFATKFARELANFRLVATGTTGGRVSEATGLPVQRMLSGPFGYERVAEPVQWM